MGARVWLRNGGTKTFEDQYGNSELWPVYENREYIAEVDARTGRLKVYEIFERYTRGGSFDRYRPSWPNDRRTARAKKAIEDYAPGTWRRFQNWGKAAEAAEQARQRRERAEKAREQRIRRALRRMFEDRP